MRNINLPWDFKKVFFLGIFRCQKYVKKGYMEMRKWIYLVPFLSAPGRSTLHYYNSITIFMFHLLKVMETKKMLLRQWSY